MSPRPAHRPPPDRIAKTTCYMCACRCGIDVHLRDGPDGRPRVAYIEGNRDHPVNRGVLCAKGASGLLHHSSPARLRTPLLRTGPRGAGEFRPISWDEALGIAVSWLRPLRESAPEKLAFFTGRDQSQSLTGFWAQAFGTPNWAAHGGFCSVNMAAAGIYTLGGAFWEFGSPDWERTRLLLLWGVAEDHDSNPIKIGLGRLKARGARVVGINPVRTGYNALADDWLGITPGTDGLLALSLVHCLLEAGRIDLPFLARFTNAPCLVDEDPASPERGLLLRDGEGRPLVIDRRTGKPAPWDGEGVEPDLAATWRHRGTTHRPVLHHLAARYLDPAYAPEAVADRTGIPAPRIRALAAELAAAAFDGPPVVLDRPWTDFRGHRHATMPGRPVAMHAMRGISAHSNGFQTCRAIHLLQALLGAVETPGAMRFEPPYPKPATAHPRPHADARPGEPLAGPPLGFPQGPEDLCIDAAGRPLRIDGAYGWEAPLAAHGMLQSVIANAHAGDPYPIDTLILYMANMAWNSAMDTARTMEMLADTDPATGEYRIPRIICSDAFSSEIVAFSDLVLPDTTYLERHDCISLLDRPISEPDSAADAIRWPVVEPDRDVRPFQSVLIDLGARLGLPGFVAADGAPRYADYADYIVNHQRRPGIGPLAGWRTGPHGLAHGRGEPNAAQLEEYRRAGGFWQAHVPPEAAFFKPWNRAYQDWAVAMGFFDAPQPYLLQLWCEPLRRFQLAAEGVGPRQPPEHLRDRLRAAMDPLPVWWPPFGDEDAGGFPLHAVTQRPMAHYHSWHSHNPWLRQIHGSNLLYLPRAVWDAGGFRDGDWARVSSPTGTIEVPVALMEALNPRTVWTWNAIGKRRGAWALHPDAPEGVTGFLLNHLIPDRLPPDAAGRRLPNADPVTGQAAWFDLRVRLERLPAPPPAARPALPPQASPVPPPPPLLAERPGP
ncbi:molybdopterin-dependent oxidoreductase [Rubellimicrobium sp. CFH 75288]|uniref:molybdopterin-dependent oxidoreductase n=1 Tax=Rubellimicrobium sp. CFH 75288 TaxID=2697034 RepID=UPI0014126D9C|nr:molybdopterin-dependent oxidoreductase [Rubellimicrobium sp. CFH 75288]NAZ38009.1 molybdopterin-dependent oxidoreductase [Rubellimicrobium sp. CFH 75288]